MHSSNSVTVFDQDTQHVCILQGPVVVKHSKVKDKPIKDLLGNVNSYLIRKLLEQFYAGDESRIPTMEYLSQKPVAPLSVIFPSGIQCEVVDDEVTYRLGKDVPDALLWLETLAGLELN